MIILSSDFSWEKILIGAEEYTFLLEIVLRTFIMFIVIIVGLRTLGKRGVKQLSIFELVVIVGLGSSAGDPMLYKEVGILSAVVVFAVVIASYSIITHFLAKFKFFEDLLEGKPSCLIDKGEFAIEDFAKENLGSDEFFAELRLKGISHLGQVDSAIVETSGEISVFYAKDEEVRFGLPIMINSLKEETQHFDKEAYYSCTFCGYTEKKKPDDSIVCKRCSKIKWVLSKNDLRVT